MTLLSTSATNGSVEQRLRIDQCGPDTLSGRYLRQFWTPVAMLDDVAPGRAKPLQILGESFTFYRGATGEAHLVAPLCPHRHVALSLGWVEDDCLRCVYHGWKYDANGQCVEQPAETEGFARKVKIASYPLRLLHGIVFAYLGSGEPPAFPALQALERGGNFFGSSYVRKTNFLNAVENNADWIHLNFVHGRSTFADRGANRELPTMTAEETVYGLSGRAEYSDGKATRFHLLMPNASYLKVVHPGLDEPADHIAWRVPIDDYMHRSFIITRLDTSGAELEKYLERKRDQDRLQASLTPQDAVVEQIIRGELHLDEVSQYRPDLVGIQDSAVMHTQPPIGEREPDRFGLSDIAVIKFRRLWIREIEALAEGHPTTTWDWSVEMIPEIGL